MTAKKQQQTAPIFTETINKQQPCHLCIGYISSIIDTDSKEKSPLLNIRYQLSNTSWQSIQESAKSNDIAPLSVLLNAFIQVIERWSTSSRLIVDTNVVPNVVDIPYAEQSWITRKIPWKTSCRYFEEQLLTSIKVKYPEEEETDIPIFVNTNIENTLGIDKQEANLLLEKKEKALHYQIIEKNDEVEINWYFCESVMQKELVQEMFDAYLQMLDWLQKEDWQLPILDILPEAQRTIRANVNNTITSVKEKCLHQEFFDIAEKAPEQIALIWDEDGKDNKITYKELKSKVCCLATTLLKKNVEQGDLVAVTTPRGPNQIIAVLAVLSIGAVYVPIGIDQPKSRQRQIHKIAGIRCVLVDDKEITAFTDPEVKIVQVVEGEQEAPLSQPILVDTYQLAYVIFTSGSTGEPKGVEITHRSAHNTIQDINKRFSVTENDKILALSALDFDLSVYDIFGLLSVGGAIVLLNEKIRREASVWVQLIQKTGITVWNSVPALLDMLLITATEKESLNSIRLAMVSGDWVGLDLLHRLQNVSTNSSLVALGGATEASIWSNFHEVTHVDSNWSSIPYGKPLENQCFRVVDRFGRDCPDMVAGELWIGGTGVAKGYLGQSKLTAEKFIAIDNQRWYRTGDLGRYWVDGTLEFLGRKDHQVKLRGYRIELGEIETILKKSEGIGQAVVTISSTEGAQHLVAAVVPERIKNKSKSPLPTISKEIQLYRETSREEQAISIEYVLFELLQLEQLHHYKDTTWDPITQLEVSEDNQAILQIWIQWLISRKVLIHKENIYCSGERFQEVFEALQATKTALPIHEIETKEHVFLQRVQKHLLESIPDYYKIISGNLAPTILLDDPILSPENLSAKDSGTLWGIQEIAIKISNLAKEKGRPIEVAVLGGRTGIMTARLLKISSASEISCTLLESAPSMLEVARKNLEPFSEYASCYRIPENRIPEPIQYKFDVVLAINTLHRYKNPEEGVALASLLVADQGKIIALEHAELSPVAIVTSAVLDKGYVDFDHERRVKYSPMLTGKEWMQIFSKYGYNKIHCNAIGKSFTELIEADCPAERIKIDTEELINHVSQHLPNHMVPEKIAVLPWFPLSKNGKVNRDAITEHFDFQEASSIQIEKPHKGIEQEIADIWKELLHIDIISRHHSFFQIGGDSLLGTRFLAIVKERYEIELSLRQIFESPTLIDVAAVVEEKCSILEESLELMEEGEI
ncbi:amino acid adenylation domain-containing protein [Aquimarina sp. I32.4]|uniref:amino acid adenylation domain-containing protein n=1 Tax=Aquimarina sp. I32.4 TaxID=2053903 RepID=UPI000CDED568|nr:amino acid adenylation domain-containing protein [Aquimarina sp. I32.4]